MKMKLFFLVFSFFIFITEGHCKEVAVFRKPDESIAIVHLIKEGPTEKLIAEAIKGSDLQGLSYELIDKRKLPNRSFRSDWKLVKNKVLIGSRKKKLKEINIRKIKEDLFDTFSNDFARENSISKVYPIISDLLEYRSFNKIKTYIISLQKEDAIDSKFLKKFLKILKHNGIDFDKIKAY